MAQGACWGSGTARNPILFAAACVRLIIREDQAMGNCRSLHKPLLTQVRHDPPSPILKELNHDKTLISAGAIGLMGTASASGAAQLEITGATGIAHPFGDGEKVSEVIVEYSAKLDPSSVSASDFSVEGREVAGAAVSSNGVSLDGKGRFAIARAPPGWTAWRLGNLAHGAGPARAKSRRRF